MNKFKNIFNKVSPFLLPFVIALLQKKVGDVKVAKAVEDVKSL